MFQSTEEAITGADDWRQAVTNLIDYYTGNDFCFSSGEIAAEIRNINPDLNFSVYWVGEYVRDLFYSDAIKYRVDGVTSEGTIQGHVGPAFQVSRTTEGKFPGRTPSGLQVFVYGSHPDLCSKHEFEVEIPTASPSMQLDPNDEPGRDEEWHQDEKDQSRKAPGSLSVRVHTDQRLCFTRPVMEAFFHARNEPMRSGGSVFIHQDGDRIVLSVDGQKGSQYNLSTSRGRVLFPVPGAVAAPGTVFQVDITPNAVIVDLAK